MGIDLLCPEVDGGLVLGSIGDGLFEFLLRALAETVQIYGRRVRRVRKRREGEAY